MSGNREWMYQRYKNHILSKDFLDGLESFIEFALAQPKFLDGDKIKCPCSKCKNQQYHPQFTVRLHLAKSGFTPNYYNWIHQGENRAPQVNYEQNFEGGNGSNTYYEMLRDVGASHFMMNDQEEPPNPTSQHFYDMLNAADRELWPGCKKHSQLSVVARLMSWKSENSISEKAFDQITELMKETNPEDNLVTENFYTTKKLLRGMGLPFLLKEIVAWFFSPSYKSSKVISQIFKSSMHKEGFAWKLVPEDKRMDYFEEFKKRYYWEPAQEGPIKEFWMWKAGIVYKNLICDIKKAYVAEGVKPSYIPTTDWEGWKAYWVRPDVQFKSGQAKKCRLSNSEGAGFAIATHYGGSRCANEHAIALTKELDLPLDQIDWQVFLRLHAKHGDYTSTKAQKIAERVYELAHERKELQDSNEEEDIDMNKIFIEVGMEHMSKGRIIGMGDRASLYTSRSHLTGGSQVSSTLNTEAMTQQLASLQTELEAEKDERTRLMEQMQAERDERRQLEERLEKQAAEQERQAIESARMKEQLDMLMQQFMRSAPPPP